MKKISFVVICMLLSVAASAQVIIGGNISFSADSEKQSSLYDEYESLDKAPSAFSFGIAPKIGYVVNGKWEIGAKINLNYDQTMNYVTLRDEDGEMPKSFKDYKDYNFNWSIQPYTRVRVGGGDKGFGVWIEGLVSLGSTAITKTHWYAAEYGDKGQEHRSEKDANKLNNQKEGFSKSNFTGGLFIQPVLTYAINEHLRLETALNFLGINLSGQVVKTIDEEGNWNKTNTCDFGLNLNSENVAQVGLITIGCVYAF